MAGFKRARAVDDDADEQYEVVESASSQLRATSKRPRTVVAEDVVSRDSTAEPDDSALPSTQFEVHGNNLEEYRRARDEVSVVPDEVDDARIHEATQTYALRKSNQANIKNVAADNGILEQVLVTNFMCHTKLEVKFGPLINFIIGHNGSGKSAVLTAITLCLGGKATSTNRGQNLKSFIKEGTDQATLQVRIKNQGSSAFKHDVYGDSIIVERHFSTNNTTGFKLKNKDGRTISTKRAELDEITDYYALQLDNPVNVLTQDQARQFLNNSTAADKYKFFIKGVQLEQLDQDYTIVGETLDQTEAYLERIKEDCIFLRRQRDEAKKKFDQSMAQESLRERISRCWRMMAWAQIDATEREIEERQAQVAQAERRVAKCEQDFQQKSQRYDEACHAFDEAQQAVVRLKDEQQPLDAALQAARDAFEQVKEQIKSAIREQRNVNSELASHRDKLKSAQDAVNQEYQRLEAAGGDNEAAKVVEVREAEAALEQARANIDEHNAQVPQLRVAELDSRKHLETAENDRRAKEIEVRQAESRLKEIQNKAPRDPWRGYFPNMRNLVNAINQETRFQDKPVGPFGRHVRLRRPDWSSILESYLGNALNGFAVTSKRDQSLLADLMKRTKCSADALRNIREPAGHATILKILDVSSRDDAKGMKLIDYKIDSDLVKKHLVINQNIDQTAIMDHSKDALALMKNTNRFPEFIKSILTKHPTKIGAGTRWHFSGSGSQVSGPVPKWSRPDTRMVMDDREAVEAQKEIISRLKADLFGLENAKRDREAAVIASTRAQNRHKKDLSDLKEAVQRLDDRQSELKEQLEELRPADGQLDALKEQLQEEEQQVEHYQGQMDEINTQKEQIAIDNQSNKQAMDEADDAAKAKQAEIDAAEQTVNKYIGGKQTTLRHKNESDQKIQDAKTEQRRCESELKEKQEQLTEWIPQAQRVCEQRVPVDPGETYSSLEAKLKRYNEDLKRSERESGGSAAELAAKAREAKEKHMAAEQHLDSTNNLKALLALSLVQRRTRWKQFRTAISIRARSAFSMLLSERAFRGKMTIDHISKLLELQVEPDATRRGSAATAAGRQTKTLSGGEKSFSTICMLLALWEAMGSPIRCLDEFDVFMDSVNRDISMRMLIEAARSSAGRQYILITPQAMSRAAGSDVRVIRLNDPERGQQVLA